MSLFIVGLDSTIVNVALPSIGRELHASVSGLQWTIDAYTLVLASLLMLSGSTADRIGRRRTFQAGLAVFTVGSLLCSLAPGLGWLVAFRMVQAVGGSMLNPVAMSIITNTFTDRRERAQAIGVWGGVFGLSVALGPVVGGALVDSVGWRGIFWVNIPVGIAAIVLCALFVPESKADRARRPDPVGQVLLIVLLAALTYGIIEGPGAGWGVPAHPGSVRPGGRGAGRLRPVRAPSRGPAAQPAVLRQCPVHRGDDHRGGRHGRAGRVPVPEHAVSAGRARLPGLDRRALPAADGGGDGYLLAAVRADRGRPRCTDSAGLRGHRAHRGRDPADR